MVGTTLGHFRIVEKIGEGGMGVVYRALDQNLGRAVALKVLHAEFVTDDERRQRFLREARTAAALNHPNIATVHEVGESDGIIFIAMELILGRTLAARIGEGQPSVDECLRLSSEIAEGLARAHQSNVVHRDLKPENIRIDPDGRVKILDFGLAKLYHDPSDPPSEDTSGLETISDAVTRDHRILGTVAYMSPEQARGLELDARSDVFAFGILLYELATGARPFRGETVTDTLTAILRDPPPTIAPLNPHVPVELERILMRCLEKKPERRYADADELLTDLKRLKRVTDSQPVPLVSDPGLRAPRARRWPWIAASAVCGALVLGLAPVAVRGARGLLAGAPTLAVIPFDNLEQPGDPDRMGQILQELIITDLTEIDSLKVLSSQRLLDVREQLGHSGKVRDRQTALEVARRAGATKMLAGSVSRLGERWILTAQLVSLRDGTVAASERVDGTDLYKMVDGLTSSVRTDLGLGAGADLAVGERTTTSLDAYQAYLEGVEESNALAFPDAARAFERAIEIDPTFGKAYYKLAVVRWWAPSIDPLVRAGGGAGPGDALRPVLDGKVKLTQKERLLAEALLPLVERRFTEARPKFERLVRRFPDEKEAWYGLGEALFHSDTKVAMRAETTTAFLKALELDPGFSLAYYHVGDVRIHERRFDEAAAEIREFLARNPGTVAWYQDLARVTVAEGERSKIDAVVDEALRGIDSRAEQRSFLYNTAGQAARSGDVELRAALLDRALGIESDALASRIESARAEAALTLGDVPGAERLARAAVAAAPQDVQALKALFSVYDRERRFDEGIRYAKQLATTSPDLGLCYGAWAKLAIRKGDERETEAAIAAAAKFFDRSASSPQVVSVVGEMIVDAYLSVGDVRNAERIVRQRLAAIEPDDRASLEDDLTMTLGLIAHAAGRFDEAEPQLAAARRALPEEVRVVQPLIETRIALGQPERALEAANDLSQMGERAPWRAAVLAEAYLVTGHEVEADEVVGRAEATFVRSRERRQLHTNLAVSYLHAGRFDDAEREVRLAVELDPDVRQVWLHQMLVEILMRRGKTDEARAMLRRALEHFPDHDALLRLEPTLELLDGNAVAAERSARRQLAQGPVHAQLDALLALALAEQGRFREAEPPARRAVARDPSRYDQSVLAWVLVGGGDKLDEAESIARAALARTEPPYGAARILPFVPSPEHCLGLAYLRRNQPRQAVTQLEQAAALRPDRAAIRRDLAQASEAAQR
jgi:tetratricopeptide (TPR) repeat protein